MCLHIRYFLLRASLQIVGKSHQWWKKTETHLAEVSLSSWFSHPGSLLLRDHHLQIEFIQIEDTFINQSLCSFTSDRERPKDKIGFSWQEWHLHWMLYAMGIYFLTCKLNLPKTGDEKYKKNMFVSVIMGFPWHGATFWFWSRGALTRLPCCPVSVQSIKILCQ